MKGVGESKKSRDFFGGQSVSYQREIFGIIEIGK